MSKSLKLPLVFIFLALFLSVPFVFYLLVVKPMNSTKDNVKGVYAEVPRKEGLTLRVSSKGGTWDLYQFLCDEHDACLKTLNIGKQWGVYSGGVTNNHEINVSPKQSWDPKFKYLKVYVRSGWGSMLRDFNSTVLNDSNKIELQTVVSDGVNYKVILVPIENINENSRILIDFRDY